MKEIVKNYVLEPEVELGNDVLSISCSDLVAVRARVTFDFLLFQGFQVTFWQDETEEVEERINGLFDLLFEEVVKDRQAN